jgi:hypothetical protein
MENNQREGDFTPSTLDLSTSLLIMKNLMNIVNKGLSITASNAAYDISSRAIDPIVNAKVMPLFDVLNVGDGKEPYTLYEPISVAKSETLDEFLSDAISRFDIMLDLASKMFNVPDKITNALGTIYDPDQLGIPYRKIVSNVKYLSDIMNSLQAPCSPEPQDIN